jgi:hypothetical protein
MEVESVQILLSIVMQAMWQPQVEQKFQVPIPFPTRKPVMFFSDDGATNLGMTPRGSAA